MPAVRIQDYHNSSIHEVTITVFWAAPHKARRNDMTGVRSLHVHSAGLAAASLSQRVGILHPKLHSKLPLTDAFFLQTVKFHRGGNF
jgi:hypothetical protein